MKDITAAATVILLTSLASIEIAAAELSADKLLDRTRIVDVEIELPNDQWRMLCDQSRDFRSAFANPKAKPFSYFEGDIKIDGIEIKRVGIRKKGFIGSLDSERPSLKIRFDKFQEQQPVDGLQTLTLNNNKQDRSLLSQCLTYQLFRKAGVHAPRSNYATVTVNGEYLGIYSHVESVKEPYLTNEFGDGSGSLYEGTLADFYPKAVDRLEAKNEAAEDRSKAMKLAKLLASEGPLDLDGVEAIVDVDNFLKFWVIESLIGFWDGYTQNQNNFFAYENPANGKFYFMPWGADSCFTASGGFARFRGGRISSVVSAQSMLSNRLYNTEGIPARYKKTLEWVLDEVWNEEELLAETDRIYTILKKEFDIPQLDAFEAKSEIRQFIQHRRQTVMKELDRDWPIEVESQPRKPMYEVELGSASGTFSTRWNKTVEDAAESQLSYEGSAVAAPTVTVSAHKEKPFGFRGFGGPNPNPPASIVLVYERPDDPDMTLTLNIQRDQFVANEDQELSVTGSFDNGARASGGFGFRGMGSLLRGHVKLSEAGMKDGDSITGEFDLKILQLHGGFMDRGRR